MKKLFTTLFIFVSLNSFSQVVSYKPISCFYRGKETQWEWYNLNIEYDKMPILKITFNDSYDALSRIDRITISNSYDDDFRFPYKGVQVGKGVAYSVIDSEGKKLKVYLDFSNYDLKGYFDVELRYTNMEYAYRLLKQ